MAMMTDIQVPLPSGCESEFECYLHLGEMSERLTANLRDWLGDEFEVRSDVRPVAFGGQWTRETLVYRDGELRATFAVNYDLITSANDFRVSCLIPAPGLTLPSVQAMAASVAVASGATALGGPLAGALAGGTTLLAATLASHSWPIGDSPSRSDQPLQAFDLKTGLLAS